MELDISTKKHYDNYLLNKSSASFIRQIYVHNNWYFIASVAEPNQSQLYEYKSCVSVPIIMRAKIQTIHKESQSIYNKNMANGHARITLLQMQR